MNQAHRILPSRRKWWPLAKRLLSIAFFVLLVALLIALARKVEWQEVVSTLRDYKTTTLLAAGVVAAASYLAYSCFDLLGRAYARHHLPWWQIMPVTFVCYAFNLNLGAWVGGLALRYRLYSRLGLHNSEITKVFTLSLLTNWLGYLWLGGLIFASGLIQPPASWAIGAGALRLLGVALIAAALIYLLLCAFSRRRSWTIRRLEIRLPKLWLAATQMLLGACNWALMGLIIYLLLRQQIEYPHVLGVLMVAAIAGVITHIPAGLGVIEAVFVALLQHETSTANLLAGLIGYRAVYYLAPLTVAGLLYLGIETRAKKLRQRHATH